MVTKRRFMLIGALASFCLNFAYASAATVNARANRDGNEVNLRLELTGAEPTAQPDLAAVKKSFHILGTQTSSMTKIINGAASSSIVWTFNLAPMEAESNQIPAIKIDTTAGAVDTAAIPIQDRPAPTKTALRTPKPSGKLPSFVAGATNLTPYKNEPVLITYRMALDPGLRNLQLSDLQVKDAIVEPQGKPQLRTLNSHGQEKQELAVNYLVTPMRDGVLNIPPLQAQGEMVAPQTEPSLDADFAGDDDDAEPFAQMQRMLARFRAGSGMLSGFAAVNPVVLVSNSLRLNVRPAVQGMDPWLPASSLKVTEAWSSANPHVGDSITRTITSTAVGAAATQLPGFETQWPSHDDYKIYAAQPQLTNSRDHGQIEGKRTDTLTMVPRRAGDIQIPALTTTWWDTSTHTKRVTTLPAEVIHVSPIDASMVSAAAPPAISNSDKVQPPAASKALTAALSTPGWVWAAIASLLVMILAAVWGAWLNSKRKDVSADRATKPSAAKIPSQGDLAKCATIRDLARFVQSYAQATWGTPAHAGLGRIFASASDDAAGRAKAAAVTTAIEAALYAGEVADLESLRRDVGELLFKKQRSAERPRWQEQLPQLNPT